MAFFPEKKDNFKNKNMTKNSIYKRFIAKFKSDKSKESLLTDNPTNIPTNMPNDDSQKRTTIVDDTKHDIIDILKPKVTINIKLSEYNLNLNINSCTNNRVRKKKTFTFDIDSYTNNIIPTNINTIDNIIRIKTPKNGP
mmetsp:Transcript_2922/g.3558  ORF Transcript_2922/g.3558 Transcript_2922/m.3558 type:complete len:139 (+) Transcript_2922:25-441(+)